MQADGELSGKELGDVVRGGVGAVNDLDSQQLLVTESLGDTNLGVAALKTTTTTTIYSLQIFGALTYRKASEIETVQIILREKNNSEIWDT